MGLPEGWVEGRAPALAVRRFLRRDDGSKIHQEDLCQALGLLPSNKYGDGAPRVTFEGALNLVTDACGEAAGREMARRIGFMLVSGNTDAHLKNWSLVWGDAMRPTLAPCYDLVAAITWDKTLGWGRRGGPELALRFGREKSFGKVDEAALAAFGERTHGWAPDEVREGIRRARDAWPEVADAAPPAMRAALATHGRKVPLARPDGAGGGTARPGLISAVRDQLRADAARARSTTSRICALVGRSETDSPTCRQKIRPSGRTTKTAGTGMSRPSMATP